jgi:uncharacterized membrane protein YkvI
LFEFLNIIAQNPKGMIASTLNNYISIWASQNIRKAQVLLFLSEVSRFLIAIFLGKSLLPRLGVNEFFILSILLLGLVFVLLKSKTKRSDFRAYAKKGLALLSCSWLLFFGLGSFFSEQSIAQNNVTVASNTQIQPKAGLLKRLIDKKEVKIKYSSKTPDKAPTSKNRKILYVCLFVLSLPLTFIGLILACNLGCAGYAVFAWISIILSFGFLGGGIHFLIRALSKKKIAKYKDLDKSDKRKARKRFFLSWGIVTVTAFLALLIPNM